MMEKPIKGWRKGLGLRSDWAKRGTNHTKRKTIGVEIALRRLHDRPYYPVTDAETYDSGTQRSKDLYGFIDILVGHDRAIQACGTDWSPHIEKLKYEVDPNKLRWWMEDEGRSLELWGWRELAVPGQSRKEWWPRIQLITPGFIWDDEPPIMLSFAAMLRGERVVID